MINNPKIFTHVALHNSIMAKRMRELQQCWPVGAMCVLPTISMPSHTQRAKFKAKHCYSGNGHCCQREWLVFLHSHSEPS